MTSVPKSARVPSLIALAVIALALSSTDAMAQSAVAPAGWFAGDMHVHRSCGGVPEDITVVRDKMSVNNLAAISLLADMGNGEVKDPAEDLPRVTGQDDPTSLAGRTVHWDAEWHWDATYTTYPHQALGGHVVALGLDNAQQVWEEYTYPIFQWASDRSGIAGFVHMQYLDDGIPDSLNCCKPIEYPVEVALGSAKFVAEDVAGGDSFIRAYYRLLNTGFRPGFAAGSDYPCGVSTLGSLLTYVRTADGEMTYRNWIDGIAAGRTVVSRNGQNEFLSLTVNGTATPGDQVNLTDAGDVSVNIEWTANQPLSGTIELVQNGVVVATLDASADPDAPARLDTTVTFSKSGWLAARRMDANGHQVHTAAVFVIVNGAPIRVSATDAQFYVQWMDNLLTKTDVGGEWRTYFPTKSVDARARYQQAKELFQQIAAEAAAVPPTVTAVNPAAGASNVPLSTAVSATFSEPLDPATVNTSTFELHDGSGLLQATVNWNAATNTAVLQPAPALAYATAYTASIKGGTGGVKDLAGDPLAADFSWTFTTSDSAPSGPVSIWNGTGTPTEDAHRDGQAIETGVKFRSDLPGYITAIRFYKGASQTGAHTGSLWTSTGMLLATATFAETPSGWQEGLLDTPVAIDANTTYVASVYSVDGYYAFTDNYFAQAVVNYPLRALADGEDGGNGAYSYPGPGFPEQYFEKSNYWVDVVYQASVGPDGTAPTVLSTAPAKGATNVAAAATVNATFSEPINAATLDTRFELLDEASHVVPATIAYTAMTRRATLTPSAPLTYSKTYTATVKAGVEDLATNSLAADYAWSFTVQAPPPPPPQEGPGGPILVIGHTANPFSRYFAEILRTEGLNEFKAVDISELETDPALLTDSDVAILGEMPLTGSQVTMLTDWVTAGGKLIAMRPDAQLASLLGLVPGTGTLANKYLAIDTVSGPGKGLVADTIQFHGTADNWTPAEGTSVLATLYSTAATATANPAVTLRNVGTNGGQAAAFTFDLARSIVYTRQGNPAWDGVERDTQYDPQNLLRSDDLFFGAKIGDVQPDWIDFTKVAIPQADELQRLLANMILKMNESRKPLPRFWYLPKGKKAAVVMTGDEHGCCGGTVSRFAEYEAQSPSACSVADWECIRASSYVYGGTGIDPAEAATWTSKGFEIGAHIDTGCANFTPSSLEATYSGQLGAFDAVQPGLPRQDSNRTHCIPWSDWSTQAEVEARHGIRLDTNYYYWPGSWTLGRTGFFTGSGMPMRFARLDGSMIDTFQATTQFQDESDSGMTYPASFDEALGRALGPEGYYGVFTTNMHTDHVAPYAPSDSIVASATAAGVPVVSGRQMLEWLDGRNASKFSNLAWADGVLTFDVEAAATARNIKAMLPTSTRVGAGTAPLTSLKRGGISILAEAGTRTEIVKGIEYVIFDAPSGTYVADYTPDTTAPLITDVAVVAALDGTSATVTWTTDEPATSLVAYGTPALEYQASSPGLVTSHTVVLAGLTPNTPYSYRVTSVDAGNNATSTDVFTFTTPVVTAPVIDNVSVTLHPSGTSATIAWSTDKPSTSRVEYGTTTLTSSVESTVPVTSHSLVLTGLLPSTTYLYRVTSVFGVMATTAPPTGTYTFTTPLAGFIDTTTSDFGAGSLDANLAITQAADGEVALKGVGGGSAEFGGTALPADWTSLDWGASNGVTMAGGVVQVNGARISTQLGMLYGPGTSIEFRAQFSPTTLEFAGFAVGTDEAGGAGLFNGGPWALVGQNGASSAVMARVWLGGGEPFIDVDLGLGQAAFQSFHTYRIDWTTTAFVFSVDGTERYRTTNTPIAASMRIGASDYYYDASALTLDWLHVLTYPPTGTFESRVFDAGSPASWQAFAWTALTPPGTTVAMATRTGETPTPDASWTSFAAAGAPGAILGTTSRYIQYSAVLSTTDASATPVLQDVAIGRTAGSDGAAPVISGVGVALAPDGTSATVTWTTNEPASSLVEYGTPALEHSASSSALVTSHAVTLATTPGTTYSYRVTSTDASDNTASTPVDVFTTPIPTAPIISGVLATPNPDGSSATITWSTDKAATSRVDYGTTADTLGSSVENSAPVTSHSLVLNGLMQGTIYYYRVTSVAGLATSEPPAPGTLSFRTTLAGFVDTTTVDFGLGTRDATLAITQAGDGELALKAPDGSAEFEGTSLPATWGSLTWSGGTAPTVANGVVTVSGARINTVSSLTYGPGSSIEFRAQFSSAPYQFIGFAGGTDLDGTGGLFYGPPWALIGQDASGGRVLARVWVPSLSEVTVDLDPTGLLGLLAGPHTYRIDWTATAFVFSVDGTPIHTQPAVIPAGMRIGASDAPGGGAFALDWLHVLPYPSSGTFASRIFDAQVPVNWSSFGWTAVTPPGTAVAMATRVGNTPTPDGSWTPFVAAGSNPGNPGTYGRYLQYQAILSTSSSSATPVLQDVSAAPSDGADTTLPTILAFSPAPNATDVARSSDVTVQFSELMGPTAASAVRLKAQGSSADVQAEATLSGSIVTLHPRSPLAPGVVYEASVAGTAADLSGNPLGAPLSWQFTTALQPVASFVDTTTADFGAGSGTCAVAPGPNADPDGRVVLPTTIRETFDGTTLPTGWASTPWSGGTATVAGGLMTVDGARADTDTSYYGPGQVFEAVMNFGGEAFQNAGLGYTLEAVAGQSWAMFGTTDGSTLLARINNNGATTDDVIAGAWMGASHNYRIEWQTNQVRFYVDGALKVTKDLTTPFPSTLRPVFSDYTIGGANLTVDSFTLSSLPNSCTFASRVIDAGQPVQWGNVTWTGLPGTGTTLSVRTGDTDTPGDGWTGFTTKTNGESVGTTARYVQYQAVLATAGLTELQDVTLAAVAGSGNQAPVAVNDAYSTPQDTTLTVPAAAGVLANDTDANADALVAVLVGNPVHGTLTLSEDGSFTYAPVASYIGPDSFTYRASDRLADSNVATVNVTITEPPYNPPSVSINDATVAEGDCGTTTATFTVSLSAPSAQTITVHYVTADGTATVVGGDYLARSGTLTFLSGDPPKTISVTVNGDVAAEGDETFFVNLDTPMQATILDGQGLGTITNDDLLVLQPGEEWADWANVIGASACGTDLVKTEPQVSWNAGASSTRGIDGDGYVEFTIPESHAEQGMFGLSKGDTDQSFSDIDFAFYTYAGNVLLFEKGVYVGGFVPYAAGDKLRITVQSNVVKYWQNTTLLYTSSQGPAYPLRIDTSLLDTGVTVKGAVLSGALVNVVASGGEPVVWTNLVGTAVGAGNDLVKTSPQMVWNAGASSTRAINGDGYAEFTVPASNAEQTMFGLSSGDTDQYFGEIAFAFYTYAGNLLVFEKGSYVGGYVPYTAGDKLQITVESNVVRYWQNGTVLYTSEQRPAYPLRVDTSLLDPGVTVKGAVLSGTLVDVWASGGQAVVWTNLVGTAVGTGNDLVKTSAQVVWSAGASSTRGIQGDGYVEFTVPTDHAEQVMFGLSHGDTNQYFGEINYAFYTYAGNVLIFENGSYVAGYVPYSAGDTLRISVESDVVKYWQNGTLLFTSGQTPVYPLRVDTSLLDPGVRVKGTVLSGTLVDVWASGGQPVNWVNRVGVDVTAENDLVKTDPGVWWGAGASSAQAIDGSGYVEFTVPVTNAEQAMFGLGSNDSSPSFGEINYAFYTYAGRIFLFEDGSYVGGYVPYSIDDRLRISVEAGVVKYWQNGTLLLTSSQIASGQLHVDTSLLDPGVTVHGAVLSGAVAP
jgi:hypothetical protein